MADKATRFYLWLLSTVNLPQAHIQKTAPNKVGGGC